MFIGDVVFLQTNVTGANLPYTIRWESRKDDREAWKIVWDKAEYKLVLDEQNAVLEYRAVLCFTNGATEVGTPVYKLPEVKKLPEETKPAEENAPEETKPAEEVQEDATAEGSVNTDSPQELPQETLPDLDGEAGEEAQPEVEVVLNEEDEKSSDQKEASKEDKKEQKETTEGEVTEAPAQADQADAPLQEIASNTNAEPSTQEVTEETPDTQEIETEAAEETEEAAEETEEAIEDEPTAVGTVTTVVRSNVRMEADGLSEIYGIAPEGTTLTVYGIEGDWIKVLFDGRYGYTYKTNVKGLPEAEPETDESGEAVPQEKKVTIFSSKWTKTYVGEHLALSSILEGFDDCEEIIYQWMVNKGNGFEEIEGANEDKYYFTADEENINWGWKLMVYYK